jgi:tetratricopeptide (TPR) repeat protein
MLSAPRDAVDLGLSLVCGTACSQLRGYAAGAAEHFNRALALARTVGDSPLLVRVLLALAIYCQIQCRFDDGYALLARALALAESLGDPGLMLEARRIYASHDMSRGDYAGARAHLDAAFAIFPSAHGAQPTMSALPEVQCYWLAATGDAYCGRLGRAIERARAGVDFARAHDHVFSIAWALLSEHLVLQARREDVAALAPAREALELATSHSLSWIAAVAATLHGFAVARAESATAGVALIEAGLERYRALGTLTLMTGFTMGLMEARVLAGDLDGAREAGEQAERLGQETGEVFVNAFLRRVQAYRARLAEPKDPARAIAYARDAIAIAKEQGTLLFELEGAMELARILAPHGRSIEAREVLASALERIEDGDDAPVILEGRQLLAGL